ncbi:MAG: biotin/lipoyl-binding protein [bacterium]|nr:biotin/lipoyl-binding protein [bacterium]
MGNARRQLVLAILACGVTACGSDSTEQVQEAVVRPVKLLVLEAADSGQSRRYPAIVEAAESPELAFQVPGLLQELPAVEAQVVDEGAVLAKLDPRDIRSSLDSAKAQFENAEAEYQRAERLAAGNAISTRDLEIGLLA